MAEAGRRVDDGSIDSREALDSGKSADASMTIDSGTPVTVDAGPTAWVYYDGVFKWAGDWSFAAMADYDDTSGAPIEGSYDIKITNTQYGGWLPYVSGDCQSDIADCFDTAPYHYLVFSAKATVVNQVFKAGVESSGDTPDGVALYDLGAYCTGGDDPAVGDWESCKVPLSAFGLTDAKILKFSIGDNTGLASNTWYLDNVGFTAD
jgi:hypothetical protein